MKKFNIEIREVLSRVVKVEANSELAARDVVSDMYKKEKIVLDDSDFLESEIISNASILRKDKVSMLVTTIDEIIE